MCVLSTLALSHYVTATHAATLSISANPVSVSSGSASTLTWSSTDSTNCIASGAWSGANAASGSQSVTVPNGLNSYALSCGGPSGSASSTVVIGAGTSAPALHVLSVTVSGLGAVTSNPSGIACGAICSTSYPSGAAVTLSATPATGYSFSGWSGACSGTNPACTVTLSAARAVTATFAAPTAGSVTLSWLSPVARLNTTPLTLAEIQGYKIYYGTSAANTSTVVDVPGGQTTERRITGLAPGTYYFRVSAYDTRGVESQKSPAISKLIP